MSGTHTWHDISDVVCPFCGLCCDDLRIRNTDNVLSVLDNGCLLSHQSMAQASLEGEHGSSSARLKNTSSTLETTIAEAATLLRKATLPVFAGLATDVAGMRATLHLADRCGGIIDHKNSAGMFRNLHVLQDSGWITTTMTEVRNRADLIIVIGEKIFDSFPRLAERIFTASNTNNNSTADAFITTADHRELIFVGPWSNHASLSQLVRYQTTLISTSLERVGEIASALLAILSNASLQMSSIGGIDVERVRELANRLRNANYSVITWFAGELDFPHAELTIETLCECIRKLNESTRCAALPLGGDEGDLTTNQVCTWQSGYPVRTAFSKGFPEYDPYLYDTSRLLQSGEVDALVWISSYAPDSIPPEVNIPTIVLGHPRMKFNQPPDVFIPVGIPGIDHSGHIYRADNVVALPLTSLRKSSWPTAAKVIGEIADRL